jgi:hypothetical protein
MLEEVLNASSRSVSFLEEKLADDENMSQSEN